MNSKHHFGKICTKHPELLGERISSNSACIECHRIKTNEYKLKRYHSDPEHRQRVIDTVVKAKAVRRSLDDDYRQTVVDASKERYHKLMNRMPKWADRKKIREVYKKARESGMTVDHEIPLRGKIVSGLHVHNNLVLLPAKINSSKGNKFEVQ